MNTRRGLMIGSAAMLVSATRASGQDSETVGKGLRLKTTDYAADRATFRTKLRYHGPSPQPPHTMPTPPADAEEVRFPSGDLKLRAWIGRPASVKAKMPVVVFLHGGFAFGSDDFDMARPFLHAGYAVITPILRGENGQPGEYSFFYNEVDDAIAAAAYVRSLPWADPDRIYLAGHSVGGTLTMLAGQASRMFRAVASFSGSPDQMAFAMGSPGIVPFDIGDLSELEMRSPIAYARSFKSPTRLYFGANEGFFHLSTPQTAALAQRAGLDVEAVSVPGDHFGAVPKELELAITFFGTHA